MYIIEKYWDNYIGSTDDSLTLLEYLIDKKKTEISLSEIFADIGLDKLNGDFRETKGAWIHQSRWMGISILLCN